MRNAVRLLLPGLLLFAALPHDTGLDRVDGVGVPCQGEYRHMAHGLEAEAEALRGRGNWG